MQPALRYPDWKAPAEDGKILIWPQPRQIVEQTRDAHKRLSCTDKIRISGIPLNELRRAQRQAIGHTNDDAPLIASGHQTELIHPGVWVKHVLMNVAAKQTGGRAVQFAVDSDSPKHLSLRWPGGSAPITDDARISSAAWCGLLDAPTLGHTARIAQQIDAAGRNWDFKSGLPALLKSIQSQPAGEKLSPALMGAILDLDRSLGLSHHALLVSPMLLAEPYLALVHHLMSDATAFARVYNAALAEFRRIHKTKSPSRPMPDLFIGHDAVEAPFWLDNLRDGSRSRPSVFATGQGYVLKLIEGEEFAFSPARDGFESARRLSEWLRATGYRLSPRALTLTTFLRLCVADHFVHGIGGGQYDQVSDNLIRNYFKLDPPAFSVTTATMFFPAAVARERVCVPCVQQEGHRLKHAVLGPRKMELVAQIESLAPNSAERQTVFAAMHRERSALLATDPAIARWEARLRQTEQRESEDEILFDRELFYGLQSRERLIEMISQYDAAFER